MLATPVLVANATIANGASLSDAVDLTDNPGGGSAGCALVGLQMPAAWTAAGLTLQGSMDGVNFANVYDQSGTEVTLTVAASRFIQLNPADFAGFRKLKLRSGTSGAPVNQGQNSIIKVAFRRV